MSEGFYFAYGSNLDAEQMRARCPTARGIERARLPSHRLGFTHYSTRWQGGAADIMSDSTAVVWGVVYEMGAGDFAKLDVFESGYERVTLEVELSGVSPLRVTSYSVREKGHFPPHALYLEKMLRWGARWRLPGVYLSEMAAGGEAKLLSPTPGPSRPK